MSNLTSKFFSVRSVGSLAGLLAAALSLTAAAADPAPALRETLSREAPNASAWALSALEEPVSPEIRRNLTYLREDLLDEGKSAPAASTASYKFGAGLCDLLIDTLDERGQACARAGYSAAQAQANADFASGQTRVSKELEASHNYIQMNWPKYARQTDQRGEILRKQNSQTSLAREAVRLDWARRAGVLRQNLDDLYMRYRAALRQDPAFQNRVPSPRDTAAQAPLPPAADASPLPQPAAPPETEAAFAEAMAKAMPPEVMDLFTPEVAALPADEKLNRVIAKLKQVNPGFDGMLMKAKGPKRRSPGEEIDFGNGKGSTVTNLWPLRALENLKIVHCRNSQLRDLSPLAGTSVEGIDCLGTQVSDLSPLRYTKNLKSLTCARTNVKDLSPLAGLPLNWLNISRTQVTDLAPLAGMPLTVLRCGGTGITDLSPLKTMGNLSNLGCNFKADRDAAILRSIKTLQTINGMPAERFWKSVDAGEAPQDKAEE